MPQLDISTYLPQVVWLVITFTAMFLVMWRLAVPRIADVLETRQKRISDSLDKAQESKKEAEETLAAYEQSMAEARAEAQAVINEASGRLAKEAAEREANLAENLGQRIAASEAEIEKAVDQAMEHVRAVALEVAGATLERLIGKAAPEKDLAKAVDRALEGQE